MSATIRIPRDRLARYFDAFTQRFLKDGSPEAVDVELLAPDLGDQFAAAGARLVGITYDPHDNALEFELESGDHRAFQPHEVWVIEEPDGFLSAIEVVRANGWREVVRVQRVGLRPPTASGPPALRAGSASGGRGLSAGRVKSRRPDWVKIRPHTEFRCEALC